MTKLVAKAVIKRDWRITVGVVWTGVKVDRPSTRSFSLVLSDEALAQRLAKCIDAQVLYTDPVVETDVAGKTFVSATMAMLRGHAMHADLKRLGF